MEVSSSTQFALVEEPYCRILGHSLPCSWGSMPGKTGWEDLGCCAIFTKCLLLSRDVTQSSLPLSPPSNPEPWFTDLAWGNSTSSLPMELTSFAPLEKFNPNGSPKNRGVCDEKQLRRDSKYRLNYRPPGFQWGKNWGKRWLAGTRCGQKKCQTRISETVLSRGISLIECICRAIYAPWTWSKTAFSQQSVSTV